MGKTIRARPKYLTNDFFNKRNTQDFDVKNELFFNSGRAALLFLIETYKKHYQKNPVLGMQSFNCSQVANAALQASCEIVLFDINLDFFSIDVKELFLSKQNIDFLILTHYQGIPNCHYKEIVAYCQEHNIVCVDDISQTEESYIENLKVGTLSNFATRSFAFDKPYTSYKGGSLVINNYPDSNFLDGLFKKYSELKFENRIKQNSDLKTLFYLYNFTLNSYNGYYNEGLTRFFKFLNIPDFIIHAFNNSIIIHYIKKGITVFRHLIQWPNKISVKRIRNEKIELIQLQRKNYKYDEKVINALIKFLDSSGYEFKKNSNKLVINWNRFSLIDETQKIKSLLKSYRIEADNYNWRTPLHVLFKNNKHVKKASKNFINTTFASKNIINIPIWDDFYTDLYEKRRL